MFFCFLSSACLNRHWNTDKQWFRYRCRCWDAFWKLQPWLGFGYVILVELIWIGCLCTVARLWSLEFGIQIWTRTYLTLQEWENLSTESSICRTFSQLVLGYVMECVAFQQPFVSKSWHMQRVWKAMCSLSPRGNVGSHELIHSSVVWRVARLKLFWI